MKKILLALIALWTVMPMVAQVSTAQIFGTYNGELILGLAAEELETNPGHTTTLQLSPSKTPNCVDIVLGDFKFGSLVFKGIALKEVPVQVKGTGELFLTDHDMESVVEVDNKGKTSKVTVTIASGAKGVLKEGTLQTDMVVKYNDITFYTRFTGKMVATGVHAVRPVADAPKNVYDLSGRRMQQGRKGLCIVNGQKMFLR